MKKILTLICCTIVLAATSCKKEYVTTSPSATTIFDTLPAFVANSDVGGYTSTLNVPEITDYYDKHGAVLVYLDNNGTYEQLPNVYGGVTFRAEYGNGVLYIDAQNADGTVPAKPDPRKVKIVLVP
ncbi:MULTISPECIES: hypothetical protein [Mucilaginibacter]|uniref:hypothetical protein n=1 Tax=Mucilaginibacter TaxID=423349 RepID=UPI00087138F2|nr:MULTISPECIES: hypothetical protein [Mucilaginibacter]NVM66403.1 hypothetical protein [Mucilaginibacter sp. SG538B]GGB11218.1 hypothetical protein GCM10011500_28810 [Mucilaginibacter rubeus]SCW63905.1 hypothetical protein SAMN03159284_02600 [Mucilaginibacter sp. NFR10]